MAWLEEVPHRPWGEEGQRPEAVRDAWERVYTDTDWQRRRVEGLERALAVAVSRGGHYYTAAADVRLRASLAGARRSLAHQGAVERATRGSATARRRLEWQALVIWHRREILERWRAVEYVQADIDSLDARLAVGMFKSGSRAGHAYPPSYRRTLERQREEALGARLPERLEHLTEAVEASVPTYREWRRTARRPAKQATAPGRADDIGTFFVSAFSEAVARASTAEEHAPASSAAVVSLEAFRRLRARA